MMSAQPSFSRNSTQEDEESVLTCTSGKLASQSNLKKEKGPGTKSTKQPTSCISPNGTFCAHNGSTGVPSCSSAKSCLPANLTQNIGQQINLPQSCIDICSSVIQQQKSVFPKPAVSSSCVACIEKQTLWETGESEKQANSLHSTCVPSKIHAEACIPVKSPFSGGFIWQDNRDNVASDDMRGTGSKCLLYQHSHEAGKIQHGGLTGYKEKGILTWCNETVKEDGKCLLKTSESKSDNEKCDRLDKDEPQCQAIQEQRKPSPVPNQGRSCSAVNTDNVWRDKWILECIDHMNAYLLSQQQKEDCSSVEDGSESNCDNSLCTDGMNAYLQENQHLIMDGDGESGGSEFSSNDEDDTGLTVALSSSKHKRKASSDHSPDFLEFDFQAVDDDDDCLASFDFPAGVEAEEENTERTIESVDAKSVGGNSDNCKICDSTEDNVSGVYEINDEQLHKSHDCVEEEHRKRSLSNKCKCSCGSESFQYVEVDQNDNDEVFFSTECKGHHSESVPSSFAICSTCSRTSRSTELGREDDLSYLQVPSLSEASSPLFSRAHLVKSHSFDSDSVSSRGEEFREIRSCAEEIKNVFNHRNSEELHLTYRLHPIKSRSFDEGLLLSNLKMSCCSDMQEQKEHIYEEIDAYLKESDDYLSLNGQVRKVMFWSEHEAYALQVNQIGTSACGATAVINVLVKCL